MQKPYGATLKYSFLLLFYDFWTQKSQKSFVVIRGHLWSFVCTFRQDLLNTIACCVKYKTDIRILGIFCVCWCYVLRWIWLSTHHRNNRHFYGTHPHLASWKVSLATVWMDTHKQLQTFQLSRFYREPSENPYNLLVSWFLSNSPHFSEYSGNIVKKS
jgi:hypothetical protein